MNTLPPDAVGASRPAGEEGAALPSAAPRKRLLYVDDDPSIRRICQLVLARSGYEVDTAENGAEAWAALCCSDYDLLITDHQMPELTGLALIRQLRRASMDLPVIMASGAMDEVAMDELHWLECGHFLAKPFSPAQLLSAVRDALEIPTGQAARDVDHWGLNEWNKLRTANHGKADSSPQHLVTVGN